MIYPAPKARGPRLSPVPQQGLLLVITNIDLGQPREWQASQLATPQSGNFVMGLGLGLLFLLFERDVGVLSC